MSRTHSAGRAPRLAGVLAAAAVALSGTLVALAPATGSPTPAAPPAAGPGSLVYVKGNDVYLARPDGTGERRLTTDGTAAQPWVSPTGDDLGTVVAARGTRVFRLSRTGTVLGSFDPPAVVDAWGYQYDGPIAEAAVTPDGSKIAYTYRSFHCSYGECFDYAATGVATADGSDGSLNDLAITVGDHPGWVTGTRLIGNGTPGEGLQLADLPAERQTWFHDGEFPRYVPLTEPAVSRDGLLLATSRGSGADARITTYEVNGDIAKGSFLAPATTACSLPGSSAQTSPAFAPDAGALAWAQADGIWLKPAPLDCARPARLVVPGGRDVAWTSVSIPVAQPQPVRLALRTPPKVVGKARPGRVLKVRGGVWTTAPRTLAYQWLRNGRPITKARKAANRVTRKDRGKRLAVRIVASKPGQRSVTWTSKPLKVRR